MLRKRFIIAVLVLTVASASGCATIKGLQVRGAYAEGLAASNGFKKKLIETGPFTLMAYTRIDAPGKPITIYIEGDGYAWISRSKLSYNPTPRDPYAFRLAVLDTSDNVAYLARPCQYTPPSQNKLWDRGYWSDKRFSEEVIMSMDKAVGELAEEAGAGEVQLVGYSGGAAIAVLVAAGRNDIAGIRTIAGNLDHIALSRHHRVSIMRGSLNPIDAALKIADVPQRHFVGEKDKIVPIFIVQGFARRIGDDRYTRITEVKGCTHSTGWLKQWKALLTIPLVSS